jgi:hypothetical protein
LLSATAPQDFHQKRTGHRTHIKPVLAFPKKRGGRLRDLLTPFKFNVAHYLNAQRQTRAAAALKLITISRHYIQGAFVIGKPLELHYF